MNTRVLMVASGAFLALLGLALTFAPGELLVMLGAPASAPVTVVLQLAGASYLGFALINWTARGLIIGGIYARPLSLGNLVHFLSGSMALLKYLLSAGIQPLLLPVLVGYALLALAFAYLVFGPGSTSATKTG